MKGTHLRDSYATWALVAINIIVFAAISIFPELAEVLLLNPGMLRERPLSLLTVFFSHEALVHILLNMLLLVVFGTRLERETNAQAVAGVYFACGLIGSVTILAYASAIGYQGGAIAGASASAFGIAAYAGLILMRSDEVQSSALGGCPFCSKCPFGNPKPPAFRWGAFPRNWHRSRPCPWLCPSKEGGTIGQNHSS